MTESLSGKVAVITGGSRGIGAAIARRLAELGSRVVLAARNPEKLEETAAAIRAAGGTAVAVPADVRDPANLDRVAEEAVRAFGGIDILVNNAAVSPPSRAIQDISLEEWDDAMNLMLRSCWYLSKLAYPSMKARGGGSIINVSSVSGYYHWDGEMLYDLPKAALFKLTHDCGREWAPDNIRVNTIAPGWVNTDMAAEAVEAMRAEGRKPNLLDRVAEPPEIAELVAYLCSDMARFITAEVIRIDGGGRPGWL